MTTEVREYTTALAEEARAANERRVLVLTGGATATREVALDLLDALDLTADAHYIGPSPDVPLPSHCQREAKTLLGTTTDAVILDWQENCRPNALGQVVGTIDGGGLLVILVPPLSTWQKQHGEFAERLAVPPFEVDSVGTRFRERIVRTFEDHRGIAIIDVETMRVRRRGLTDPPPRLTNPAPELPGDHRFPDAAYDACLTSDQVEVLHSFERITDGDTALVIEADRGRGKSSVAGLAAAVFALGGDDVLVTAPTYEGTTALFERAEALLDHLDALKARDRPETPRTLETATGRVRFLPPTDAAALPEDPDSVIVDEAAGIPVRLLESFLAVDHLAFVTTVHGYEGTGRGFDVRFRDRLADARHEVLDCRMAEPIRYATGDPIEVWAFRALGLDARPPVAPLVTDARPESVSYRRLSQDDLVADEHLLSAIFGLLIVAHYRTEPDDFARLLDAPNVSVHVLEHEGHVVAVALLAREGGLDVETRATMYRGERVPGNMIPDVLTGQLRDEDAGVPVGQRVLRIATHGAVRSRGLGSRLLADIRVRCDADWLGAGFGATPRLVRFWRTNGYRLIHLSTSRNQRSGDHSAVMLNPLTADGEALLDRHTDWLLRRLPSTLTDSLAKLNPDIVREVCRAIEHTPSISLSSFEWQHLEGMARGAAIFDTAPRATRQLFLRHLVSPKPDVLSPDTERLLVRKALQAASWHEVAAELDSPGETGCKRTFGDAVESLVGAYEGDIERDGCDTGS